MSTPAFLQFLALIVVVIATTIPLGRYIAKVFGSEDDGRAPGDRVFRPIENVAYKLMRVDPESEQTWKMYTLSLIAFSLVSTVVLYVIMRVQDKLPFNPTKVPAVGAHLAFNTANSFVTNTNWQAYGGEATMSHLTQIGGLLVQHFASAAVGMCVVVALIRGIARSRTTGLGNFWVDLVRGTIRILVPMAVVFAFILASQGVIANFHGFRSVTTLEGVKQMIPGGPVAGFLAIKQIGSNGGGFFNMNSAHPFENPTQFSNFVELYLTVALAFGLAFAYGHLVKDKRQGRMVFGIMFAIWLGACLFASFAETNGNPALARAGADQSITAGQGGGNMEGKDVRFGVSSSAVWGASVTFTSNGSVNSMHDSWTPMGSMMPFMGMLTGEVTPGGVGVGLMGLLVNVLFAVFIAGLMIGRTPEYLGKKLQSQETKLLVLYLLAVPAVLLGFTAASLFVQSVLHTTIWNAGTHGFSEIFYAFTSAAQNNGSAFAGITAATPWMDTTMGLTMLVGRFFLMIPVLAIAGSLVRKPTVPTTSGTLATHTAVFGGLVTAVIFIVAGLTYFPALALGPILEHLHL
ncbi:MAG TPA: potassium-transporting ATPase subunit KdpA [Acidimicrobiales bacterium]|nr:potassium-transporting ATPase subunit KdpA [Acidimicrobiales bacterium]